jgi:hypothetical protein
MSPARGKRTAIRSPDVSRLWTLLAIACFALALGAPAFAQAAETTDPVVQWNQTLLKIVRTHGAQPATVHPTRSFAIMHAAMRCAAGGTVGLVPPCRRLPRPPIYSRSAFPGTCRRKRRAPQPERTSRRALLFRSAREHFTVRFAITRGQERRTATRSGAEGITEPWTESCTAWTDPASRIETRLEGPENICASAARSCRRRTLI